MIQRRTCSWARLWLSTGLCCGVLAAVSNAHAIPAKPPPAATLVYGAAPIPANGGLIIQGSVWVTDATVRILTPDGQPVAGKLKPFGNVTVWTPDRPLTPGFTYDVTLSTQSSSEPSNNYEILVTPARAPARPAVTSMLTVSRLDQKTGLECCSSPNGVATDFDSMCFASQDASYVAMKIELASTTATPELAQYLFKLGVAVLNQTGQYDSFGSVSLTYNLQAAASEYCFDLQAMDIASGQTFDYRDLMPRCRPHGNLGTIGTTPIAIDLDTVLAHTICAIPPTQYLVQWCNINVACSDTPSQAGCEQFGQLCRGASPSAGTTAGIAAADSGIASGVPGTVGEPATAGRSAAAGSGATLGAAGSAGTGALVVPHRDNATHVKACSATRGAAGSASGWLGYLAVTLLFARRRLRSGERR